MENDHLRWRDLILCHEDLEGTDLVEADAHLAACAECRGLLGRVRAIERSEPPRGMLPPLGIGIGVSALSPAHRDDAERSLRMLRERLGLPQWRNSVRRGSGRLTLPRRLFGRGAPLGRVAVPLALAAGLALVPLISRLGKDAQIVHELRVMPSSIDRGGADTDAAPPSPVWRTGDAFVLVFDLARATHPVVFHVGPAGGVTLLHPAEASTPVPRLPAGRGLQLPLPGGQEVWALEGEPGPETFVISAADDPDFRLEVVLADVATLVRVESRRQDLITALVRLLTERLGPVQTVEIDHRL